MGRFIALGFALPDDEIYTEPWTVFFPRPEPAKPEPEKPEDDKRDEG